MTYFVARFGVLGVYVTGRTREKCGKGGSPASLTGSGLRAAVKKT
jgi:hypothetical protein